MSKPHLIVRRSAGARCLLVSCANRRGCRIGYGVTFAEALNSFLQLNQALC